MLIRMTIEERFSVFSPSTEPVIMLTLPFVRYRPHTITFRTACNATMFFRIKVHFFISVWIFLVALIWMAYKLELGRLHIHMHPYLDIPLAEHSESRYLLIPRCFSRIVGEVLVALFLTPCHLLSFPRHYFTYYTFFPYAFIGYSPFNVRLCSLLALSLDISGE